MFYMMIKNLTNILMLYTIMTYKHVPLRLILRFYKFMFLKL